MENSSHVFLARNIEKSDSAAASRFTRSKYALTLSAVLRKYVVSSYARQKRCQCTNNFQSRDWGLGIGACVVNF